MDYGYGCNMDEANPTQPNPTFGLGQARFEYVRIKLGLNKYQFEKYWGWCGLKVQATVEA